MKHPFNCRRSRLHDFRSRQMANSDGSSWKQKLKFWCLYSLYARALTFKVPYLHVADSWWIFPAWLHDSHIVALFVPSWMTTVHCLQSSELEKLFFVGVLLLFHTFIVIFFYACLLVYFWCLVPLLLIFSQLCSLWTSSVLLDDWACLECFVDFSVTKHDWRQATTWQVLQLGAMSVSLLLCLTRILAYRSVLFFSSDIATLKEL